jgi:hypothetical protein
MKASEQLYASAALSPEKELPETHLIKMEIEAGRAAVPTEQSEL